MLNRRGRPRRKVLCGKALGSGQKTLTTLFHKFTQQIFSRFGGAESDAVLRAWSCRNESVVLPATNQNITPILGFLQAPSGVSSNSLDAVDTIIQSHATSDGHGAVLVHSQRNLERVHDLVIQFSIVVVCPTGSQIHSLTNSQLQIDHLKPFLPKCILVCR